MYFKSRILCEELDQYQNIIIYGTGDFSQKIFPQLVKHGLKKKILCFTNTGAGQSDDLDGIPVINIKDINYNKAECVVLIAVSKLYTDEIKQTLMELEYPYIVSLIDYCIHYKFLETSYQDLNSFEEYCEYIADWCERTHKSKEEDKSRVLQKILCGREHIERRTDDNLIVMICGHLSSRMVKITRALKKKNYNIILLSYFDGGNPWNIEELKKLDIQIFQCRRVAEMLYYALQYHPLVYFFEPWWGDCLWAEIMLKHKEYFGKIVLALYDVMNDGYNVTEAERYVTEKFALEHADGIVWRWFSKEYLEQKGFKYQGKSIQFLDYCNQQNTDIILDNPDSSLVKICFISGDGDDYIEKRERETRYTDWARVGEILEKIGNRSDCIFHCYIGNLKNEENIVRCRQYEMQYTNFKFFLAVEHDELLERLKYYDYGCELWTDGKEPPNDMLLAGKYYGSQYNNSVRNAYFDFFSAGLPVITTQASKMWEYLSADDAIIKMTLSDLDIEHLKEHKQYYKAKVAEKRNEWNMDNQIYRLIQFFKGL